MSVHLLAFGLNESPSMLTLSDISPGNSAIVEEVLGDDSLSMRIMEMGFVEGIPVKVIGYAPMGDPIEVELRGYRLSLRKDEARRVTVTTTENSNLS